MAIDPRSGHVSADDLDFSSMPASKSTELRWRLAEAVAVLTEIHGRPRRPAVTDPFEMALCENAAYLVDDARRAEVFENLRARIGLAPRALAGAPDSILVDAVRAGGMRPQDRAAKLKRCAELAEEIGVERLREMVRTDPVGARKLLKRFPGIGEPGADKILLYNGRARTLAPDSNVLRVLVRLGFGKMEKDYGRTYRSAVEATAAELPSSHPTLIAARELLRRHGQELCHRNHPRCEMCPLSARCEAFRAKSFATF
jgi:endonuclease III